MNRAEKEKLVASLHQVFEDTTILVVTHYSGLTVAEMGVLRDGMREAGAKFRVTKNRFARLALQDTKFQDLSDLFTGPTAIAYSDDPVAAAKASVNFAKINDKFIVLGGALGSETLAADGFRALAGSPSSVVIRGSLSRSARFPRCPLGLLLQAPAAQVARVLCAHAGQAA